MPTRFLSPEQRSRYGKFTSPPSQEMLARYFHIDADQMRHVSKVNGMRNKLGFAVVMCSVPFIGTIPTQSSDVPDIVIGYLAEQLDVGPTIGLEDYFAGSRRSYRRHVAQIRSLLGLRDFYNSPMAIFGVTRRLYALNWTGEDRPSHLMQWATDWLIAHSILLPGVSTLERLVGRVRDRVQTRVWQRLVNGLSTEQLARITSLIDGEDVFGGLDIIRSSPLKRKQSELLRHLDRLEKLQSFGLSLKPPKGVPATALEKMARQTRRAKSSAIIALKEPRRTAHVAALFYTLEASAQDDGAELAEALLSDLFRKASAIQGQERIRQQQETEEASSLLARLMAQALNGEDEALPLGKWLVQIYASISKPTIEEAIDAIAVRDKGQKTKPIAILVRRWNTAKKLFGQVIMRLNWLASPNGQAVLGAMQWLKEQSGYSLRADKGAPTGFLSKAWKPLVLDEDGKVKDRRAYIFALIDEWLKALKRRDIFVSPGIRYGDPRVGLLKDSDWLNNKAAVCRALNHSMEPEREIKPLVKLLDTTFKDVAARADKNTDLKFETVEDKKRFSLTPLDRLPEPNSLLQLRKFVRSLLPQAGITDILLEVMQMTGFNSAFTHLSDRPSSVEHFESTLCAVLIGNGSNIGFTPLVRSDVAPLRASRLSWCEQNFVRAETIQAANAMIVDAHSKLDITKHWGDGHIASADGLRFLAPKSAIHAGPNPKYFGRGRGITWYNMLSDQYSGLGATVVPGTLRDSLALLALLLNQDTELEPTQIMTDTAAYSDAIFGLFWLLGYNFSPRLADVGSARLWRISKNADYGCLNELIDGAINLKLIEDNWEDLLRLAGSLKLGHLKAEGIMRILQVRDRPTTLAKALVQLGRIHKTLHILNFADDAKLRRKILIQLNRQEFRHKLARKIYHGDRGEVRNALKQGQEEQLGVLGLVMNAIIYWNAVYMQEAITELKAQGQPVCDDDIARLSPILWHHINFLGRYDFDLPDHIRNGGLRPLRHHSFEYDF